MGIAEIVRRAAATHPDKVAVTYEGGDVTYQDLDRQVDAFARFLLEAGMQQGEFVGLILGNHPAFIPCYFGTARAGGTNMPLNPLYKKDELEYMFDDTKATFLVVLESLLPVIEKNRDAFPHLQKIIVVGENPGEHLSFAKIMQVAEDIPVEDQSTEEGIAVCLYTSGTTGKPKGALLSHGNLLYDAEKAIARVGFKASDVHLLVLPLFHSFSLMACLLTVLYSEGRIVLMSQFLPDKVLRELSKKEITVMSGVPAMFGALLSFYKAEAGHDLSALRLCITGGAPMPPTIAELLLAKHDITILEGNGPTETSPIAYVNPPEKCKAGSVGPPLEGVEVKIVDEADVEVPQGEVGEICVRGPVVMQGYLNQPEATAEAMRGGWFHTGDLGRVDEDGYVFIVDRKKDMIIVGGLNVYPREVEEVMGKYPKVAEVAVVGFKDEKRGEAPLAIVVLKPDIESTHVEILTFTRRRLANFKVPRKLIFVDKLPRTSTGKIDKKQIREAYALGIYR
jgi:long-chain acyl-CoA synthetase